MNVDVKTVQTPVGKKRRQSNTLERDFVMNGKIVQKKQVLNLLKTEERK